MADVYTPTEIPAEYDVVFLAEEFRRISAQLQEMELPYMRLVTQHVVPDKLFEGLLVKADGTNWNPGHGAGVYSYEGAEWVPLFDTTEGKVTAQLIVENTVTETEIYSVVLAAESLHAADISVLTLGGSYDTGAASDTWTLRVKLNGTLIHTLVRQSTNNVTAAGWMISVMSTIRTEGVSGTFVDLGVMHDDVTVIAVSDASSHAINTTVDNTISMTLQWGTAKVANIFRLDQGFVAHHH